MSRRTIHWKIFADRRGNHQRGQRPGAGGDGLYLQAAQAELWEAVRGRKEVVEKDCTEIGFAENPKPQRGRK